MTLKVSNHYSVGGRDIFIKFPRGGIWDFGPFLNKFRTFWKNCGPFSMPQGSEVQVSQLKGPQLWTFLYTPRGSELHISHKTSKKYLKNIQKSITELLHLAATTTRRIIVPHVTYTILDLFGLSKFKGGQCPLTPLIKISLGVGGVEGNGGRGEACPYIAYVMSSPLTFLIRTAPKLHHTPLALHGIVLYNLPVNVWYISILLLKFAVVSHRILVAMVFVIICVDNYVADQAKAIGKHYPHVRRRTVRHQGTWWAESLRSKGDTVACAATMTSTQRVDDVSDDLALAATPSRSSIAGVLRYETKYSTWKQSSLICSNVPRTIVNISGVYISYKLVMKNNLDAYAEFELCSQGYLQFQCYTFNAALYIIWCIFCCISAAESC